MKHQKTKRRGAEAMYTPIVRFETKSELDNYLKKRTKSGDIALLTKVIKVKKLIIIVNNQIIGLRLIIKCLRLNQLIIFKIIIFLMIKKNQ